MRHACDVACLHGCIHGECEGPPVPPCDALAECAVLNACLIQPALSRSLPLRALDFYYPEYRRLWQAMQATDLGDHAGTFTCDLINEIDRRECGGAHVGQPVSDCRTGQLLALMERLDLRELASEHGLHSLFRDVVPWATERVLACAEARRLVSVAQDIATRAWRVPESRFTASDARILLERVGRAAGVGAAVLDI